MDQIPLGLLNPKVFKAIELVCKHGLSYSNNHSQVKAAVSNLTLLLQQETSEMSVEVVALRNLLRRSNDEFDRPALRLDPIQELGQGSYPKLDSGQQEAALRIKQVWSSFGKYLTVAAKNLEGNGGYRGRSLDPISVMSDEVVYLWKEVYCPWYEKAKKTFVARSGINEAEITLFICVEGVFPHEVDKRFALPRETSLEVIQRQLKEFNGHSI
jgi:hypothetical protein